MVGNHRKTPYFLMRLFTVVVLSVLWGCSFRFGNLPSANERAAAIVDSATNHGWQLAVYDGGWFDIAAFIPTNIVQSDSITVYIEGDGVAWINNTTPSTNPTPSNALALQLALEQQTENAVYLARPCQYVVAEHGRNCEQSVWTAGRFSEQVIEASNRVINQLKERFNAKVVTLVGYSGGATVSMLVAARRSDVVQIVTVAGNLDHRSWSRHHKVTPLGTSLNPTDFVRRLSTIPQIHFVGGEDDVVPLLLTQNFVGELVSPAAVDVKVLEGVDHHCCWVDLWAELSTVIQ